MSFAFCQCLNSTLDSSEDRTSLPTELDPTFDISDIGVTDEDIDDEDFVIETVSLNLDYDDGLIDDEAYDELIQESTFLKSDPHLVDEDDPVTGRRLRTRRSRRRAIMEKHPFWFEAGDPGSSEPSQSSRPRAAKAEAGEEHLDQFNREALHQLIKDEAGDGGGVKRIVKPTEVRNSTGAIQERWKVAAEAEMHGNFEKNMCFPRIDPR